MSSENYSTTANEPNSRSSRDTDDAFHIAVPALNWPVESPTVSSSPNPDPSFMQNQTSLQRALSGTKSHITSQSHQLFIKSNTSSEPGLRQSEVLDKLNEGDANKDLAHSDSTVDVTDGLNACSLYKSSSVSARSISSVKSVAAVGTHPFGSLRVLSDENNSTNLTPQCLLSGDVIIVTGMPPGSVFGFDTVSFNLGKEGHFEGVRELPSGPHFVYGGSSSELSTRNGFWIMSQRRASSEHGEIFVRRWDSYSETLEDELSAAEVRIQKDNVTNIFIQLMPYTTRASSQNSSTGCSKKPQPTGEDLGIKDPKIWNRLTFAIKGAILTRITGQAWNKWHVSSTHDSKPMEMKPTDAKTNTLLDLENDRTEQMAGKNLVLTFAFPKAGVTYSSEVIGRARTEQALDTSVHIVSIIHERCTYGDADEVIGELQFCYITGMLIGNLACQEQWAHIVKVIFKAFRLAMDMPAFFRRIIETFHAQLMYDEDGIQGSIFDHDAYLQDELKVLLTIFKSRLNEQLLEKGADLSDEQTEVGKAFEELESWLWKWGWDLRGHYLRSGKIQLEDGEFVDAELAEFEDEDERGEFAPVVVDLDEDGREKGLIRW